MVRDTSINTYHDIIDEGIVSDRQMQVLRYLKNNPNKTDTEIAIGLRYGDMNKVRPRRKELYDFGIVEENGKKVCSITNRKCYQWRVVKNLPSKQEIERRKNIKKVKCPYCKGTGQIERRI